MEAFIQEFDPAAPLKEETIIRYFREGLKPSIQGQLDARGQEPNSWEEAVEKTVDVEAKALLQSPSDI